MKCITLIWRGAVQGCYPPRQELQYMGHLGGGIISLAWMENAMEVALDINLKALHLRMGLSKGILNYFRGRGCLTVKYDYWSFKDGNLRHLFMDRYYARQGSPVSGRVSGILNLWRTLKKVKKEKENQQRALVAERTTVQSGRKWNLRLVAKEKKRKEKKVGKERENQKMSRGILREKRVPPISHLLNAPPSIRGEPIPISPNSHGLAIPFARAILSNRYF
ncbi:conserved hypothetical protein [Ricinus communis]|uniref:Uncharacterized protein n=1 Tax=Ricinus communis TaxID=3988 RepID=B9S771_RICCO|nr:conserved hypothetical protein [Ricinus communis]